MDGSCFGVRGLKVKVTMEYSVLETVLLALDNTISIELFDGISPYIGVNRTEVSWV